MKKIFGLLVAILLLTNVCFAANGTGKLASTTGYMPAIGKLPDGYHLTLTQFSPAQGPNSFITDENISAWKAGDDITFMDPDQSHACTERPSDTVLINTTKAEWVCANAVVAK
jgi:hypothetical protein